MVVCVDKYTAVKMYDLVQHYWDEEKLNLIVERNNAKTIEERKAIDRAFDFMNKIKMAVVISEDGDDDKFTSRGLNIRWENGKTIPTKIIKVKLNKLFDRYDIKVEAD